MENERAVEREKTAPIASYRALIKRLPVTLRPALSGQLAGWETLFPFELRRVQEFMRGIEAFDPAALAALLGPMRRLEAKMGVKHWDFSESADTMENASLLARSVYYAEWRDEVRRIYARVEDAAHASGPLPAIVPRVIVAILPAYLPYDRATLWRNWEGRGMRITIDGDAARITDLLFGGSTSIPQILAQQGSGDFSDLWLIDAASKPPSMSAVQSPAASLNYAELRPLRDRVLAQVNTIPKNIEVTDQTLAAIRNKNWDLWLPAEMREQAPLRRFIIDLFLSGNGALIFSNAFVQWTASEAIRRARPRVVVARFGLRAKPKPFTGIAIFENPQHISALPDVDDPKGSAVDALVLARYVLLAAQRYPEGNQTASLCVAESAGSAYLVLPEALKNNWTRENTATPEEIAHWMMEHLAMQTVESG